MTKSENEWRDHQQSRGLRNKRKTKNKLRQWLATLPYKEPDSKYIKFCGQRGKTKDIVYIPL